MIASQASPHGLSLFTDGSFDPVSGRGGWAFIACQDQIEMASDLGSIENSNNNSAELAAALNAILWINGNAAGKAAEVFTDSDYVLQGCSRWRHIWKNNGWKRIDPNSRRRRRAIVDVELWRSIDAELRKNPLITIAWCKGHSDVAGNLKAHELAEKGRLSIAR